MRVGKKHLKLDTLKTLVFVLIVSLGLTACKSTQRTTSNEKNVLIREKLHLTPKHNIDNNFQLIYDTIYKDSIIYVKLRDTIYIIEDEKIKSTIEIIDNTLKNTLELKPQQLITTDTTTKEKEKIIIEDENNDNEIPIYILAISLFLLIIYIIFRK